MDLSALLVAEQFAGTANLQVGGQRETGPSSSRASIASSRLRASGSSPWAGRDEIRIGDGGATDATAQLMELARPSFVGSVDDDGVALGTSMPLSTIVVHTRILKRWW